jgi:hypothetical protein
MTKDNLKRYLPEEVPDHLFTQNKLKRMGLVPTEEHVAFVVYPEQGREYKCKLSLYFRTKKTLFCTFLRNIPLPLSERMC